MNNLKRICDIYGATQEQMAKSVFNACLHKDRQKILFKIFSLLLECLQR